MPTNYGREHAGLWPRTRAFAWDYLVLSTYLLVLLAFGKTFSAMWPEIFLRAFGSSAGQFWGFLLATVPITMYFALSESSRRQATFGKSKVGLRVVDRDGARLSLTRGIARAALKFLPWELAHACVWQSFLWKDRVPVGQELTPILVAGITLVWLLIAANIASVVMSQTRQTLYDRIAGTFVVRPA